MAARLMDVAREAGVSRVLAGKILLGGKSANIRFSAETEARVREAAEALGYSPNHTARQLRGVRSRTIGVLMPIIESDILFTRLRKFVCAASAEGYGVLVRDMPDSDEGLLAALRDFESRQMEGVLSFDYLPKEYESSIDFLKKRGPLSIFYGDTPNGISGFGVDLADGVSQAVKHLLESGYTKIGLCVINSTEVSMRARIEGYKRGLRENGLSCDDALVWSAGVQRNISYMDTAYKTAAESAVAELVDKNECDALIASNDVWALSILKRLSYLGVSVPGDVGIVGCDNTPASLLSCPELTTIDLSIDEQMPKLMEFFLNANEKSDYVQIEVKPRLVSRETTAGRTEGRG